MQSEKEKDLSSLSREELEAKIHQLEAHNLQLKNLLSKSKNINCVKPQKKMKKEKEFDFSKYSKRHILLKFAYLGWGCQGFAVQEDTHNTIEAALFDALHTTKLIASRETSNYHRCGRTDKGVSAFAQVISITVRSRLPNKDNDDHIQGSVNNLEDLKEELSYAQILNRVLPPDIRVVAWSPVPEGFSSRFDCVARKYKYFFPLANLNLEAMSKAAHFLIGEHDYRNFCKMDVGNGVVNFKRKIINVSIKEISPENDRTPALPTAVKNLEEGQLIPPWEKGYRMCVATFEGAAFLWHQIRAIMTVLLLVGEGKEEPKIVEKLLDVDTVKRKPQYGFASEIGLNLYDCQYENVTWQYDEENVALVISQLQSIWVEHAMKSSMLHSMLGDLSSMFIYDLHGSNLPSHQVALCIQDAKTKVYKPLLQRQMCESLEERVKHFVKRRRLDAAVLKQI